MKKITESNLSFMVRQVISGSYGKIYDDLIIYGLSVSTLRYYLGDEWTNQNTSAFFQQKVSRQNRKGRSFFRTGDPIADNRFRHQLCVIQLSELIFNLQHVEGIYERIEKIKQGTLESFYGELKCASQIKKANLPFRFVIPYGKKGKDYDIEIILSSGKQLNCEIEVITEEKTLVKSTILNKLNHSKKQLPKENPCIVFLKIPESWNKQADYLKILSQSSSEFLRGTKRVTALVLLWDNLIIDINNKRPAALTTNLRIEPNITSDFYNSEIESTLQEVYQPSEKNWTHFRDFIKKI